MDSRQRSAVCSHHILVLTVLKMKHVLHLDLCAVIVMSLLHSIINLDLHAESVYLTSFFVWYLLSVSPVTQSV